MNCKLVGIVVLSMFALGLNAFAQDDSPYKHAVSAIAKAHKDSIVLRWAPASPSAWQYANKYGYKIKRITVLRDGNALPTVESKDVVSVPLKPQPLDAWEPIVKTVPFAPIAAQALYGKEFKFSEIQGNILQMASIAKEQEQRFSFALFSADLSSKVAEFSALKWTDKDVKINEKYLYLVFANVPANILPIDTGSVFISPKDFKPVPTPKGLEGDFGNKSVMLRWDRGYFEKVFTAWKIERSEDGKNFKATSDLPIVNPVADQQLGSKYHTIDSLPQNEKKYYLRVRGITPFGELSPPSEVVEGVGFLEIKVTPKVKEAIVLQDGQSSLKWEYPDTLESQIQGFNILRAAKNEGPYLSVNSATLPANARSFADPKPMGTNYYMVSVLDQKGREVRSFPHLIQLVDSIPPAAPVAVKGKVDTTGLVHLKWTPNLEQDIFGYKVYRANYGQEEYSLVTPKIIEHPEFVDSVVIRSLTSKVFYKIIAVDQRFNNSEFSEPVVLVKPDLVPPAAPAFTDIVSTDSGAYLSWANSSSEDVVAHLLFRRLPGQKQWRLVNVADTINKNTNFLDQTIEAGKTYEYTLIATDRSKLESAPIKPVTATKTAAQLKPEIKNLYSKVDREKKQILLTWVYDEENVFRYLIYRKDEDNSMKLIKALAGHINTYEDKVIKPHTTYQYLIRAEFRDGNMSKPGEAMEVKY